MSYSLAFTQAIVTLLFVADKVAMGKYEFVPTKVLSEELNIPLPSAAKILQALNRAGFIETREGAKGGVRLVEPPDNISILDILNAIESGRSLFRTNLNMKVQGSRPDKAQKEIKSILEAAEHAMQDHLSRYNLGQLRKKIS